MLWGILIVGVVIDGSVALSMKSTAKSVACDVLSAVRFQPFSSSTVEPTYLLFTPGKSSEKEIIEATATSIKGSSFDQLLPLKVLIPGYMVNITDDDIRLKMKDELLKFGKYNVIIVDWSEYNRGLYTDAVKNAKFVGEHLAQLLNMIIENYDYDAQNIHIIGHSLGAHLSGWAGEKISNLGRITGLDPAGPCFLDAKDSMRLDVTDAEFVDIIHTNGAENGFGISAPVGHIDFFPNGGKSQPGCVPVSDRNDAVSRGINSVLELMPNSCDHTRASDYFLESIGNSTCQFQAVRCRSFDDYNKGKCSHAKSVISQMGFHAKRIGRLPVKSKFFLKTHSSSPFCI